MSLNARSRSETTSFLVPPCMLFNEVTLEKEEAHVWTMLFTSKYTLVFSSESLSSNSKENCVAYLKNTNKNVFTIISKCVMTRHRCPCKITCVFLVF